MNRIYLCEWRNRVVDGETEFYPSLLDVEDLSFSAVDLRPDSSDPNAALVKADIDDAEHAALIADPSVEYLFDA